MILFQVDLLEQRREEAFILLGITGCLFVAALILIAILILRKRNRLSEEASLEFSPETPKIASKKQREKRKSSKSKKESPAKNKKPVEKADPIPMEVGTKKKEEVPEDFMPKDASKKIEHNPKGESPKERLGEHPQKESRGETNQEPVQLPLKPTSLKEKLEAKEPPKPIEKASAPVPKMKSAPLPKNIAASKPEPPKKTKDEVAKSVAEAISKANSKEENLARIQAYLDELKAKNPQAKSTPPTDIKPDKGEEKEPNKEGAKDLDKTLESIQDLPDPVMPAGALNPPFVPTLILPESPNAESISLELKIETEDALEPATKGLDEATKESQEASLSSLQASGPDTKGEQPPKEIIEAKDSSVNEAMYPSLEGSTTKTEVPETTPSVQIEPERNFEEAKQEQSQDSKPQKEEVEPLLSEEKKPKSSKAKKMPSEGYRSFADWLRQTKG